MESQAQLARQLSLTDAISLVIGVIVGAGIFVVPNLVARSLGSDTEMVLVWVAAGVLSFFGALAFAELGAMMPSTGGQYVFLREAFHPLAAFLCGWTFFFVSMSAALAWVAVNFALYLQTLVPMPDSARSGASIVAILILTWINHRGVSLGAFVQRLFTGAKVAGILLLVVTAWWLGGRTVPLGAVAHPSPLSAFGLAMIACLLTYDGWVNMSFVAGEIRDPQKNVSRALAIGTLACMAIYLLANLAYAHVFSPAEMAGLDRVGSAVAAKTMGSAGERFITLLILVSIVGGMNGRLMTQARLYFAQAQDGLFLKQFGELHPVYRTPSFALWAQAAWAAVLVASGTYETLADYAMFSIWIFYAATVVGLFVLRRTRPDVPRPYRMWGYPVTPLLFLIAAVWFVGNTIVQRPGPSLIALGLMATGIPAYWWSRRAVPVLR